MLLAVAVAAAPATAAIAQTPISLVREWTASIEADQGWESNVLFTNPDDPGDAVSRLNGGVTGLLQNSRTRAALTARGGALRYRQLDGLNSTTYGLGADLRHRVTPRFAVFATGGAYRLLSSTLTTPGEPQALLPLVRTRTTSASAGADYRFAPRLSGAAEAGHTDVSFESPGLAGGRITTALATVSRHYGDAGATYGLGYELQRNQTAGRTPTVHSTTLRWNPTFGPVSGRFLVGGSVTTGAGEDGGGQSYGSIGAAELRRRLGRGEVGLGYTRAIGQGFGFGQILTTDGVAFGYNRTSSRQTTSRVALDWFRSRGDGPGGVNVSSLGAEAEFRRLIDAGLSVGLGAFARRRDQQIAVNNHGLRVSVNYTRLGR